MLYGTIFMLRLRRATKARTSHRFLLEVVGAHQGLDRLGGLHRVLLPSIFTFLIVSGGELVCVRDRRDLGADPVALILWPFKMVVPLACLLLLIQGVSEVIKSVWAARTGIELEHKRRSRSRS